MIKKEDNILKDYIFKIIFGRVASKELLEDFLERILDIKVEVAQIVNNEIIREAHESKSSSLDLVIITKNGDIITIEVQNESYVGMEKRIKHYSDRLGSTMLKKGDDYCKSHKVISIAILNHKIYKQKKDKYKHVFKILNTEDQSIYDDDPLEIIIFDKMKKENYNINNPRDRIFMYLYGLLNDNELKTVLAEDSLIRRIEETKNMISKSQEAEILKIEIEKRQMDEQIRLETVKKESEQKGIEKGIKEGEEKEKFKFALKLKNKGFSLDEISEITELPFEKVKNLISK
ncbi:MAG: Rpn family recombination-promoting nuclease/putative transposase [Methanobrevibacter sp.]|jgi:predicted transposase/invertase (TIGR01784 family)|nr:Rpn family recombination-promoting nuclease/putative transposase [Methanobrevibacter sp.]